MTYADQIGEDAFLKQVSQFFEHDYHDRGMLKWQGYFLSDHTAALKKQSAATLPAEELPQQDTDFVRSQLARAEQTGESIEVQLTTRDTDDLLSPPFTGKVAGRVSGDTVVIADRLIPIETIRAVHLLGFKTR